MKSTEQKLNDLKYETDRTRAVVSSLGDEQTAQLLAQVIVLFDEAINTHTSGSRSNSNAEH